MSSADDFNHDEIISGRLTMAEITELVKFFQAANGLDADGKAGPLTQGEIDKLLPPNLHPLPGATPVRFLANPLPLLGDGRRAQVTSSFRPADRPDHDGCDFFYPYKLGDQPAFVGDKGGAGKKGGPPTWVVPYVINALAAASGKVQMAGDTTTGHRLWIDHGNGLRTGYFHLLSLAVAPGQIVTVGQVLGLVGDNPIDKDGRHLHFELSPVDRYAPMDPEPYLIQ